MSRYPWRDTSTDISGGQPPQWETPAGAQKKADDALAGANAYTDQQVDQFVDHINNTDVHVTTADKANWNSKAAGDHTHSSATPTAPGFMSASDKAKLNGIEAEANKYVHPATHPPSIIAQDQNNRFVSDAEKTKWNGKAESSEATESVKGLMSAADKAKLNGIEPEANNYIHPTSHPPSIIAQDPGNRFVSDVEKTTWDNKAESTEATATTKGLMTSENKTKLDGIEAAAEVNQNAFSSVNNVSATSKTDTLQITGGTGITVTTDPSSKRLTVTATGDATPGPHASSHITGGTDIIPDAEPGGDSGLMSGADAQFVRIDVPARFLELEEYVNEQIAAIPPINDASLTGKGIVQLSSSIDQDNEEAAATPKAVKTAYDEAIAAKQLGVEQKANVVAALNSIGVAASTNEAWDELISKIAAVIKATGTATAAQVLAGATFSNQNSSSITGTMTNRGTMTLTPGASSVTIPAGYHNGSGIVSAVTNLLAANIAAGENVGGVAGTYTADATAIAGDMLSGKTAYANGSKVTGSMANRGAVSQNITTQNGSYTIPAGYHNGSGVIKAVFANLVAANIKSGVNIGGVTGTLKQTVPGQQALNYRRQSGSAIITPVGPFDFVETIATVPAGCSLIYFTSTSNTTTYYSTGYSPVYIEPVLRDSNGVYAVLGNTSNTSNVPISTIAVDILNKKIYTDHRDRNIPSNFNSSSPMTVCFRIYSAATGQYGLTAACMVGTLIYV
ncbi:phage tail protein [Paenibacillus sp. PDC88]|uniref:tail fiber protein n=1 Tax=Paenibacillus sp. PDC88 TaxID=1884375 RepID=UPI000899E780|nr:phage tail protein [Paenibacillus sp. PDC88]SDW30578.1 Phage tail fibre repeat-containing protein [Paenibacillus sp. PDC88]